jgi:hypothetical protein
MDGSRSPVEAGMKNGWRFFLWTIDLGDVEFFINTAVDDQGRKIDFRFADRVYIDFAYWQAGRGKTLSG